MGSADPDVFGDWQFLSPTDRKPPTAFSEFVNEVHAGHVEEIHIKDREYSFRMHTADNNKTVSQHESVGPMADSDLIATLKPDNKDTPAPRIFFEKDDQSPFWSSTIITLLPMLFIGVMSSSSCASFRPRWKGDELRKAKARMLSDSQNKVTFADVAGVDEAKDEVEENHRLPQRPEKIPTSRRPYSEGRFDDWSAGHR